MYSNTVEFPMGLIRVGKKEEKLKSRVKRTVQSAAYVALSPVRFFKVLCFWIGFSVLLTFLGVAVYAHSIYRSLPDFETLNFGQLKEMTRIVVQQKLEDPNHVSTYHWVAINDVSRDYLYAIVLSEDSTFFEHDGINYEAIINALTEDMKKKRAIYGGSTISQQVVKNLFLTADKSVVRKIKELLITRELERHFSKNQILELYLNVAEFGPEIYGVRQAALRFFNKTPAQINAAEGVLIAIMLPSPKRNYYAVFQNQNISVQKRRRLHRVLGDMVANEYISQQQYHSYVNYDYFKEISHSISFSDTSRGIAHSRKNKK